MAMGQRGRRVRGEQIDWDMVERVYLGNPDRELYTFSSDHTGDPRDPSLSALKKEATKRNWHERKLIAQKRHFAKMVGKDKALDGWIKEVETTTTEEIICANQMLLRHIGTAKKAQIVAAQLIEDCRDALQYLDLGQMAQNDPGRFIKAIAEITDFLQVAQNMERRAYGGTDLKIELSMKKDDENDMKTIDVDSMGPEELLRQYMATLDQDQ